MHTRMDTNAHVRRRLYEAGICGSTNKFNKGNENTNESPFEHLQTHTSIWAHTHTHAHHTATQPHIQERTDWIGDFRNEQNTTNSSNDQPKFSMLMCSTNHLLFTLYLGLFFSSKISSDKHNLLQQVDKIEFQLKRVFLVDIYVLMKPKTDDDAKCWKFMIFGTQAHITRSFTHQILDIGKTTVWRCWWGSLILKINTFNHKHTHLLILPPSYNCLQFGI